MALTDKLSAIGNAIREKGGTTELLTLDEMPAAIDAIETGGGGEGLPEEALYISDSLASYFPNNKWNWYIEHYGEQVTTENITSCHSMCSGSTELTNFKIKVNGASGSNLTLASAFYNCNKLTTFAEMSGCPYGMNQMFRGCNSLRELPEGFASWFDWSKTDNTSNAVSVADMSIMFNTCYSLRTCPIDLLSHGNPNASYSANIYNTQFSNCYCLDEIVNLPNPHLNSVFSTNVFASTVKNCARLKTFTFAPTKTDGSANIVKWKNQTLDLSSNVGYTKASALREIYGYNSGITADEEVYDDTSYQALKNNPNWWSQNIAYSRYNHDSAVATINSLPDTSAYLAETGGTNTIKFEGASGSATDGGAINTLTEEEIAVATAKGWTVTLV